MTFFSVILGTSAGPQTPRRPCELSEISMASLRSPRENPPPCSNWGRSSILSTSMSRGSLVLGSAAILVQRSAHRVATAGQSVRAVTKPRRMS